MAQVILVLVVIGVGIYALVDCLRSDEEEIRGLPKPLWLLVILLLQPAAGALLWIFLGREPTPGSFGRPRPKVTAPDDDPDFLRTLDRRKRDDD